MLNKLFSHLKTLLGTCKKWFYRISRSRYLQDSESEVITSPNKDLLDEQLEEIAEKLDEEISVSLLEDKINSIETKRRKLSTRQKNKYNNRLEQLLLRASARLNRLHQLSFEEIDIERILISQKSLARENNDRFINTSDIDFKAIRAQENIISTLDLTQQSLYAREYEEQYSTEIDSELSQLLNDLRINAFSDDEVFWQTEEEIAVEEEIHLETQASREVDEIEDIINHFKGNGIYYFHHVTNIQNIDSIRKLGLLSWSHLDASEIRYHNFVAENDSRQMDLMRGKQDFVRLSFCKSSPMFHLKWARQTNTIFRISIDCLRECKFEFSNMNAVDSKVKFGSSLRFIVNNLDLTVFKEGYSKNWPKAKRRKYQAEVLIKNHIPTKHIIDNIHF